VGREAGARTALIVIDLQNAFMLPGVAFVEDRDQDST